VVLVGLELLVAEGVDRLAVLLLLVDAAVPARRVLDRGSAETSARVATYCARLSEREKALPHRAHTYGRSCVCVRTCLGEKSQHRFVPFQRLIRSQEKKRARDDQKEGYWLTA
jgi:hypothetical protein